MATISPYSLTLILLFLLTLTPPAFSERCHPDDKKALLKIKKDFNNAPRFASMKPETDCCEWTLVVLCDEKTNRVTQFDVFDANLHNLPIPPSIGELPYLQQLTLNNLSLAGRIPESITKLSELIQLDLRQNHLTGPVPSFLSKLKNLAFIGFSFNNLAGSIPASLSQLPKLSNLQLEGNKLTGPIPESFGNFQAEQFYLYASHNQLSGKIPRQLVHANFSTFDVSSNRLEGDLSFFLGKSRSLVTADFSRNSFEFDMSRLVSFPDSLQDLDLSHNRIFGRLPESLVAAEVRRLNVSYNRLCGEIPVGGGLQGMDSSAFVHNKCLCGAPLPKCK